MIQSNYPSIVHLRILMRLYYHLKKLASNLPSSKFYRNLYESLREDKIVEGFTPPLFDKLTSHTATKEKYEKLEGISEKILDSLTNYVCSGHTGLDIKNNSNETITTWQSFVSLIGTATYLNIDRITQARYYGRLENAEKEIVDRFTERKVYELIPADTDICVYTMYYWNEIDNKTEQAIVTINLKKEYAVLKYLKEKEGSHSVQRTDVPGGSFYFKPGNNTIYLNFVEEDANKSFHRTNICLAIRSIDFGQLALIKGTFSTSRQSGEKPASGVLLFRKRTSFKEAYQAIKNDEKIPNYIQIEILGHRYTLGDEKIRTDSDLSTYRLRRLIEKVNGAYVVGFIRKQSPENTQWAIRKGLFFIHDNGVFDSKITPDGPLSRGYVTNSLYMGDDSIRLCNFFDDPFDHYKYDYFLKLHKDKKSIDYKLLYLIGSYAGMSEGAPRSGEIFFIKQNDILSFTDLCEKIKPTVIYEGASNLSECDKTLMSYFTNKASWSHYDIVSPLQ